jgi:acylpyruvate hydrolase
MKLLTFRKHGERSARIGGVSKKEKIVELASAYASYLFEQGEPNPTLLAEAYIPMDMIEFIEGGQASFKAAQAALEYVEDKKHQGDPRGLNSEKLLLTQEEIEFLPPVVRPTKMLSCGQNYAEHLAETGRERPERPVAFSKLPSTFLGHRGEILWTENTPELDYEIELAFVIGKEGKYIARDDALDYVYGYIVHNDVSERSLQRIEMERGILLGGKNIDTSAPLGPWIVSKDEIKDPHSLNLTLRVNGEIRQNSNTKHMIFNIFDLIAYWSTFMTLYPGDIFSTGTPSGVASRRKPSPEPFYLKPGDIVEADIEGLGVLMNTVVREKR